MSIINQTINKTLDVNEVQTFAGILITRFLDLLERFIIAIILWWLGDKLINLVIAVIDKALKNRIEGTLIRYLNSAVRIGLRILLVITILGNFGIQTSSFAALVATIGIAIGAAWGGLLSNFAAGIFLIFLRPFKVGDLITAGGVNGIVYEIGIFTTTIHTADGIKTVISNSKLFADNILNFSATPYRRVDIIVPINYSISAKQAIELIKPKIHQIPNVLVKPETVIEIFQFNPLSKSLIIRSFCANNNYWQVYFDINRLIEETFYEAGYPPPEKLDITPDFQEK